MDRDQTSGVAMYMSWYGEVWECFHTETISNENLNVLIANEAARMSIKNMIAGISLGVTGRALGKNLYALPTTTEAKVFHSNMG